MSYDDRDSERIEPFSRKVENNGASGTMLTATMPRLVSTIDQIRASELPIERDCDEMAIIRMSCASVTTKPRRKAKPITRFLRMEKHECRSIGIGVSILNLSAIFLSRLRGWLGNESTYVKISNRMTNAPMTELKVTTAIHFPSVMEGSHCFVTFDNNC